MPGHALDASAALALLAPSQATDAARRFAVTLPTDLFAPLVFQFEVRQAALKLERRGLLPVGAIDAPLAALEARMSFEPSPDERGLADLLTLARSAQLSFYDTTYLDAALRQSAVLISRDTSMIVAAHQRGVQVHDLR